VKFPKHPDTLEIEKLRTHMPLFAHLFEKADIKVKNLVAATLFLPIKAEVRGFSSNRFMTYLAYHADP